MTDIPQNDTQNTNSTKPWFVYIAKCSDGSLYTGVTTDLTRRELEHNSKNRGARYTRIRQPVKIIYSESLTNRSDACKRESAIKKLPRQRKLYLMRSDV